MRHLSDEQLARLIDMELSGWMRLWAERHLQRCAVCQQRKQQYAAASRHLSDMLSAESHEFRGPWLRTRVRTGIKAARQNHREVHLAPWGRVLVALPVLVVVAAGIVLRRADGPAVIANRFAMAEPDRRLTPGAVRAVGAAMLCRELDEDFDPEVSAPVRQAVLRAYGMNDGQAGGYQVDYLVSPQLGGTNAIENLWPEPYATTMWNAHTKDALEVHLRRMVCDGSIDLNTAQQSIREDWIAAYRKYMGADPPPSAE